MYMYTTYIFIYSSGERGEEEIFALSHLHRLEQQGNGLELAFDAFWYCV